MDNSCTFSLVLCTLNRSKEVESFLESLLRQTYKNFECIIIDQNKDNRVKEIIDRYIDYFPITYHKSCNYGLSLNRNIGLKYVQGKIVAFPDDDCEYKTSTLSDVLNHFEQDKALNILTINTFCKNNHCFFCDNIKIRLTPRNYYSRAISMGIFVRYINKDDLYFDENMGVGAYWGAGEESDFVSSLLSKSYIGLYNGMISIYHPQISVTKENLNQWIKRYRNYGLGYGALMKKEIVMRHKYYYIALFARDLLGRLFASALPIKKRKLYWVSFKYRLLGFLSYKIKFHAKSL